MPKHIFVNILLVCFVILTSYFLIHNSVSAEDPTPTPQPTCDMCGWCNKDINPKPSNWDKCYNCLYKSDGTQRDHTYYTVMGCFSTQSDLFVKSILSFVFGIAGGIAFLAVLSGSGIILTSSGDPQKLQHGKEIIISSISGILLIIFSVFLLRVVGVDILNLPGFG